MSKRHRESRVQAKVPKEARRQDHRRDRHTAKAVLLTADPEGVVLPAPRHLAGEEGPMVVDCTPAQQRRRFRHWKAPFWKRRTTARHQKNEQLEHLFREV